MRDAAKGTRIKQGNDIELSSYAKMKAASARLTGAQHELEVAQSSLEERLKSITQTRTAMPSLSCLLIEHFSECDVESLLASLSRKRETKLLYRVMEDKGRLRNSRVMELITLMERQQ